MSVGLGEEEQMGLAIMGELVDWARQGGRPRIKD